MRTVKQRKLFPINLFLLEIDVIEGKRFQNCIFFYSLNKSSSAVIQVNFYSTLRLLKFKIFATFFNCFTKTLALVLIKFVHIIKKNQLSYSYYLCYFARITFILLYIIGTKWSTAYVRSFITSSKTSAVMIMINAISTNIFNLIYIIHWVC